jgi:hypothetical protein
MNGEVIGFNWEYWIQQYGADPAAIQAMARNDVTAPVKLTKLEFLRIQYWKGTNGIGPIAAGLAPGAADGIVVTLDPTNPAEMLRNLVALHGIRVKRASAVLAVLWPQCFAVLDWRVLSAAQHWGMNPPVSPAEMAEDTVWQEYYLLNYSPYMRDLAPESGLIPRHKDMALWAYSREQSLLELVGRV